ncbi:MAG TPA: phosphatase PAP2 family protein [Nocardioidaceae bacterium]|nr:phosphatase PAP2 family protein [Nocardioidaceae bacterium]
MRTEPRASTPPLVRLSSMLVYLVALTVWSVVIGLPKQTLTGFLWIWLALIAWNIRAPWREHLSFPLDWWPALAVLTLYLYSRGMADQFGFTSVHVTEPIDVDRALFGGTLPTEYLQAQLCGVPCDRTIPPEWYDVVLTTVYYTFFFLPLLVAAVLWLRDRAAWIGFMRRYLSLYLMALVIYVLYPVAPPWMAAEAGFISLDIDRITSRGWYDLGEVGIHQTVSALANQVAAMPSLHAAVTLLLAWFGISRWQSPWRWALLLYPLTMGFVLVYYAEHYVIDVIAGFGATGLVFWGCGAWERWRVQPAATPA